MLSLGINTWSSRTRIRLLGTCPNPVYHILHSMYTYIILYYGVHFNNIKASWHGKDFLNTATIYAETTGERQANFTKAGFGGFFLVILNKQLNIQ